MESESLINSHRLVALCESYFLIASLSYRFLLASIATSNIFILLKEIML